MPLPPHAGKHVVLIESRAIGAGQTGRMTGQALGWWTHSFQDAETRLGAEKATVLANSIKCAAFSFESDGRPYAVRRCAGGRNAFLTRKRGWAWRRPEW